MALRLRFHIWVSTFLEESIKKRDERQTASVDLPISSKAIISPPVALCTICEGGLLPVSAPWPSRIIFTASGLVKMMTVLSKILTFQRKKCQNPTKLLEGRVKRD